MSISYCLREEKDFFKSQKRVKKLTLRIFSARGENKYSIIMNDLSQPSYVCWFEFGSFENGFKGNLFLRK